MHDNYISAPYESSLLPLRLFILYSDQKRDKESVKENGARGLEKESGDLDLDQEKGDAGHPLLKVAPPVKKRTQIGKAISYCIR